MANLKNYLQSARKENKTVDVVELTVEEELKRTDLDKLKKGEITIAEARGLRKMCSTSSPPST